MKIIHSVYSDRKGGLEQAFINVTKMLLSLGHEVELWVPENAPYTAELDSHCNRVDVSCRGYFDLTAILRSHLQLRSSAADLIITHNSRSTALLGYASIGLKMPHLAFSHGYKTRRFKSADHLVVLTDDMRQHFLSSGRTADEVSIFPNVIAQLPELPPYVERLPGSLVRMGFVGRLNEEKGLQDLMHALTLLKDSCALELHVAGSGPDQHAIEALAERLGISQHVQFSGWVDDIACWLSGMDLAVFPSRHEPFGIVVLEAAAYGCPVISTSVSGPASQITHGVDGWLAEPGSPASLAKVIQQVVAAPESWVSVREAAHQRAQSYLMEYRLDQLAGILAYALSRQT